MKGYYKTGRYEVTYLASPTPKFLCISNKISNDLVHFYERGPHPAYKGRKGKGYIAAPAYEGSLAGAKSTRGLYPLPARHPCRAGPLRLVKLDSPTAKSRRAALRAGSLCLACLPDASCLCVSRQSVVPLFVCLSSWRLHEHVMEAKCEKRKAYAGKRTSRKDVPTVSAGSSSESR
eukprot:scaffold23554_cov18-Tisochrysis_lutea.AAC.2